MWTSRATWQNPSPWNKMSRMLSFTKIAHQQFSEVLKNIQTLLPIALLLLSLLAVSRSYGQEGNHLAAIKFTGLDRFTDAQVSRATGLRIGEGVSQAQLAAAADRLANSGAFDHVTFRYSTEKGQLTVEFQLTETPHMLPCRFDNFVWFSDQQLDQALRARVPFYAGAIPETGATVEEVLAALQDMIRANGIPGDVDSVPFAEAMSQGISGFLFSVKNVSLPIRSVDFPGAAGVPTGDLLGASSQLIGRNFSISGVTAFASGGLVPLYHQHGYLRAKFDRPEGKVLSKSSDGSAQEIGVSLPVAEGPEFYWDKAEWSGNRQFSSFELDRMLGMSQKEVANEQKIEAGLQSIKRAYDKRGFIDSLVQSNVILDDATRLTTYNVSVREGIQYHFSQVHFDGITDQAAQVLVKKWQLKPGDVFDVTYASDFMNNIAPLTLKDFGVLKASFQITPQRDTQKASVDLHIVFH
jgi:outer membrane protein assembly factor BamA